MSLHIVTGLFSSCTFDSSMRLSFTWMVSSHGPVRSTSNARRARGQQEATRPSSSFGCHARDLVPVRTDPSPPWPPEIEAPRASRGRSWGCRREETVMGIARYEAADLAPVKGSTEAAAVVRNRRRWRRRQQKRGSGEGAQGGHGVCGSVPCLPFSEASVLCPTFF
jgi:hypothetical protein